MLTDAKGRCLKALLSSGQAHDLPWATETVAHHRPRQLLADRGYDSEPFRRWLRHRRIRPVIPGKANRLKKIRHDRVAYRRRGLVENFFSRMKQWSALALRREKSDAGFLALVHLFVIKDWLQWLN